MWGIWRGKVHVRRSRSSCVSLSGSQVGMRAAALAGVGSLRARQPPQSLINFIYILSYLVTCNATII